MDFWRTVDIIGKRKWLILLSGVVAALLMWGATRLIGSRWMASVDFVAPMKNAAMAPVGVADSSEPQSGEGAAENAKADTALYDTIVKSQAVTEPVLHKLHIASLPGNFLKDVEFTTVGPRLFQLQVTDANQSHAAQLANALADQFIVVNHDLQTLQAQKAVNLLEAQLSEADKNLKNAQAQYDHFQSQHQIIGDLKTNVDMAFATRQKAILSRDEAVSRLMDAQGRLHQKEAQLAQLPPLDPEEAIFANPQAAQLVATQQGQLSQAEEQLATLRQRYTDRMPEIQAAITHRDALAAQLKQTWSQNGKALTGSHNAALSGLKQAIQMTKQDVAGDQAQISALNKEVQEAQQSIDKFKGLDGPLGTYTATIAQKTDARNSLSMRLNNARLSLDGVERQSPLVIMNRVNDFNPPVNMTKGRTLKLILLAVIAAMVCACAVIIALNSVDRRLRTVGEAELVLPKGILAAIPQPSGSVSYSALARITELQPQSLHSEAYRFLGLHLLTRPLPQIRSIMVLAAKAEQGSTTTLTNLGITLAQAGKRVIIVDANIRTSEIHTVFGVDNDYGFTDVLQSPSHETLERALHHSSVPGLSYITSGPTPDNPWGLFRSQNLIELSHLLHQRADLILYDTPSSLMFTDALNIAPVVDGAILCVRAYEPLTGTEERLVELLEEAKVTVLGSVLNDVPADVLAGYNNYQSHYEPAALALK